MDMRGALPLILGAGALWYVSRMRRNSDSDDLDTEYIRALRRLNDIRAAQLRASNWDEHAPELVAAEAEVHALEREYHAQHNDLDED